MIFLPVRTRLLTPPKDEIWDILDNLEIQDGDIVFITSKILALHQGRTVTVNSNKQDLIRQESTHWLPYRNIGGFDVNLTITNNILIPSAGIDESNAEGHYILWPKNVDKLCAEIRKYLIKRNPSVKNLGVISTDSHTTPLRWGVTGITTGFSGVKPLRDIRGEKDLFGKVLRLTQVNLIDPLTSMAVLLMGECAEQTPIVILRDYKAIPFCTKSSMKDFVIPPKLDLYYPLLVAFKRVTS